VTRRAQRRLTSALMFLAAGAATACGGDGDGAAPFATAERDEPGATATNTTAPRATTAPGDDDEGEASGGGTTIDDILLHGENWWEEEDELGRPAVRYAAIVENTGSDAVEVEISFEAFDASGASLGGPFRDYTQSVGPGGKLPFALAAGPLDASPVTLEPEVSIRQIPDFRRERYGRARIEGEIVSSSFEVRSTDVEITLTISATNTGMAGTDFGVLPHIAIYDGDGLLIDGSFVAPGFILCPGQSDTHDVRYRVSFDDFDPETASYEVFFPDVEVFEPAEC
jgi:hypothetical protein